MQLTAKLNTTKYFEEFHKFMEKTKAAIALAKETNNFEKAWIDIMANKKLYNEEKLTFTLRDIKKTNYGWSGTIFCPRGLSLETLEANKEFIEYGLCCDFIMKIPTHKNFAQFKIVFPENVKCNQIPFHPQVVKPYQIYCGVDSAGEPIIFDVNFTPHVFLAGQTRRGKNGPLDHIVTSLIYSCSEKDVVLYMWQCAKADMVKYENCKQVKSFVMGMEGMDDDNKKPSVDGYNRMLEDMREILAEIKRRSNLLKPMIASTKGTNLFDYNRLHPDKKLPYIYIVIDEFMDMMTAMGDINLAPACSEILSGLTRVAQFGGALGITYIISHQKPSKELCPIFLKNMSLVRICFGFLDDSCGRIVLGDKWGGEVTKLPARKAIYIVDGVVDILYTTDLTNRIKPFIAPSEVHREEETATFIPKPISKGGRPAKTKIEPSEDPFAMVNKKMSVEENMSKIPNVIPYKSKK